MRKITVFFVLIAFLLGSVMPPQGVAQSLSAVGLMSAPGTMVQLSEAFVPAILKGMKVYPADPLRFDFLVDTGNSALEAAALEQESAKLVRYFMASLTVPEEDLWVNLSPYEGDRIIPNNFGLTEMGRDLLAEDYILKQLTSSLMYPEKELGRAVWKRIYALALEKYGTTDIPFDTFNKVWIMPDEATVYVNGNTALIASSHLKVMLDTDYLAMKKNTAVVAVQDAKAEARSISEKVIREVVLPEIEKEVNGGKNFSTLRQIFHAMILSTWFKRNMKKSLVGQAYTDKNKVAGIDLADKEAKGKIWNQYVEAFKKGAFNYIKEEMDERSQELIPRKYFSGGYDYSEKVVKEEKVSFLEMVAVANKGQVGGNNVVQIYYNQISENGQKKDEVESLKAEINRIVEAFTQRLEKAGLTDYTYNMYGFKQLAQIAIKNGYDNTDGTSPSFVLRNIQAIVQAFEAERKERDELMLKLFGDKSIDALSEEEIDKQISMMVDIILNVSAYLNEQANAVQDETTALAYNEEVSKGQRMQGLRDILEKLPTGPVKEVLSPVVEKKIIADEIDTVRDVIKGVIKLLGSDERTDVEDSFNGIIRRYIQQSTKSGRTEDIQRDLSNFKRIRTSLQTSFPAIMETFLRESSRIKKLVQEQEQAIIEKKPSSVLLNDLMEMRQVAEKYGLAELPRIDQWLDAHKKLNKVKLEIQERWERNSNEMRAIDDDLNSISDLQDSGVEKDLSRMRVRLEAWERDFEAAEEFVSKSKDVFRESLHLFETMLDEMSEGVAVAKIIKKRREVSFENLGGNGVGGAKELFIDKENPIQIHVGNNTSLEVGKDAFGFYAVRTDAGFEEEVGRRVYFNGTEPLIIGRENNIFKIGDVVSTSWDDPGVEARHIQLKVMENGRLELKDLGFHQGIQYRSLANAGRLVTVNNKMIKDFFSALQRSLEHGLYLNADVMRELLTQARALRRPDVMAAVNALFDPQNTDTRQKAADFLSKFLRKYGKIFYYSWSKEKTTFMLGDARGYVPTDYLSFKRAVIVDVTAEKGLETAAGFYSSKVSSLSEGYVLSRLLKKQTAENNEITTIHEIQHGLDATAGLDRSVAWTPVEMELSAYLKTLTMEGKGAPVSEKHNDDLVVESYKEILEAYEQYNENDPKDANDPNRTAQHIIAKTIIQTIISNKWHQDLSGGDLIRPQNIRSYVGTIRQIATRLHQQLLEEKFGEIPNYPDINYRNIVTVDNNEHPDSAGVVDSSTGQFTSKSALDPFKFNQNEVGGIDLNSDQLKLNETGGKVDFGGAIDPAMLAQVAGFSPVVLSVTPMGDPQIFFGAVKN